MFFLKRSLKTKKVKHYLEKIDSTIDEMRNYEMLMDISQDIAKYLEDDPTLRTLITESKSPDDAHLIEYANHHSPQILHHIRKIPHMMSGQDWEYFKEHINAEIERPEMSNVENIAFAGGGAKGFAYPGVIRAFDEENIHFKRVAGTSAGALTALPLALGYSSRKIESIVYNYDFTNFIYESNLNRSYFVNTLMGFVNDENEALMHRSTYLETFYNEFKEPFLQHLIYSGKMQEIGIHLTEDNIKTAGLKTVIGHAAELFESEHIDLDARKRLYSDMDDSLKDLIKDAQEKARNAFIKSVKESNPKIKEKELDEMINQGFNNEKEAVQTFFRIHRNEDVIEEFFGDLIENKLMTLGKKKLKSIDPQLTDPHKLRNIDFEQFQKLVDAYPETHLKSLAVCVCEKKSDNPFLMFTKSNYEQVDVSAEHEDESIRQMPLKKAVRMSMNLPGAYSSYKYNGKEYVDGGVRANFPLHYFDKTLGMDKDKTLGVCLTPADSLRRTTDVNKIGTPEEDPILEEDSVLKSFFKRIGNMAKRTFSQMRGNKLDNNDEFDPMDLTRIGVINVQDVSTTDFSLRKNEKLDLFAQGYHTAKSMTEDYYSAQHRHLEQRIQALFSYVDQNLEEKDVVNNVMESHQSLYEKALNQFEAINQKPKEEYVVKGRVSKNFNLKS